MNIPIFAKAYDLYKLLSSFRSTVPKHDRHGLWQRTEEQCLFVIESLFLAGQRTKECKFVLLEKASVQLNLLRFLVRLAKDTKAIDLKKYAQLQHIIDEIGRMLGGWIKSTKPSNGTPPPSAVFKTKKEVPSRATKPDVVVGIVAKVVVHVQSTVIPVQFRNVAVLRLLCAFDHLSITVD